MRSYLHLAIFTVVGPSIAHAAVSIWVARRVPGMKSRRARLALAVELVVLGTLVPVAGRLGEILPFPWNAIVGATEVWNFALVCVAPALAGLELVMFVLWFSARRKARSRERAAAFDAASDATSALAADEAALAAHAALSRREAFAQIAGISAIAGTVGPILWGGLRTRVDVEITEVVVKIARLPKVLDGFSIVQISDVHVGPFVGEAQLRVAEEIIASLRPDLIAMTGDLVQHRLAYAPMAAAWLGRLRAKSRHGLAMIPGNHEHYAGVDEVLAEVRRAGCEVLFNASRIVAPGDGGGFGLVGVDDLTGEMRPGGGPRVAEALTRIRDDQARVLLCHQPSFHANAAAFGFDLMLSGHTHGGQVAPFGPLVVGLAYRNIAGLSRIGETPLYVNRGFGTSGPPTRVLIRPEITKIVLVSG